MKIKIALIIILLAKLGFSQNINQSTLDQYVLKYKSELSGLKRGFDIAVVSKDKVIYHNQSGGINDDTPIHIASASKWLSGAVIMKLADEGLLSLNDPIKKFFPKLDGNIASITVRQLFSHSSGIDGKGTFELIKMGASSSLAEQAEIILAKTLAYKPGQVFSYGGESMQVAGRIAEIVSNNNFESLFQDKIAKPLEMKNTTFTNNNRTPQVAGGAVSSLQDYLNFLNMLSHKGIFRGRRILSETAVSQLLANQIGNAEVVYSPFSKYETLFNPPINMKYGIGNWREEDKYGHLKTSSSPGAFGFTPWIDHENGYYGIIATLKSMKEVFPVYLGFRYLLNSQLK